MEVITRVYDVQEDGTVATGKGDHGMEETHQGGVSHWLSFEEGLHRIRLG